jgi:hypothetical protein
MLEDYVDPMYIDAARDEAAEAGPEPGTGSRERAPVASAHP